MLSVEIIGWAGDIGCIIGSLFISHKIRAGYLWFFFSEILLLVPVVQAHVWNQAALGLIFMGINIYGFLQWKPVLIRDRND